MDVEVNVSILNEVFNDINIKLNMGKLGGVHKIAEKEIKVYESRLF